jgi:hypothetical protein
MLAQEKHVPDGICHTRRVWKLTIHRACDDGGNRTTTLIPLSGPFGFYGLNGTSGIRLISSEMHDMGKFILSNAQAIAEGKGAHAAYAVRQGEMTGEVVAFAREIKTDYISWID